MGMYLILDLNNLLFWHYFQFKLQCIKTTNEYESLKFNFSMMHVQFYSNYRVVFTSINNNIICHICQITVRREDRRDPEKLYNKMTIRDLATKYPGVRKINILSDCDTRCSLIYHVKPLLVALDINCCSFQVPTF